MTTPEKTVDEIVEEFAKALRSKNWPEESIQGAVDWLTQTLTAERQKRDEVVEAEREIRFQMMEQIRHDINMTLYDEKYPQRLGLTQATVKDFTQPNNQK